VVLRLGTTAVSSAAGWQAAAGGILGRLSSGLRPVIVTAAPAGVTDLLEEALGRAVEGEHSAAFTEIEGLHRALATGAGLPDPEPLLRPDLDELSRLLLAGSLLREVGPRLRQRVFACGERLVSRLGAAYLSSQGIDTAWTDPRTCLVAGAPQGPRRTVGVSGLDGLSARLGASPAAAFVIPGALAGLAEPAGDGVAWLGRGGADLSAACLAEALAAERCEIWSGVPGLFTADPALLGSARLLRSLGYDEAQEMATTAPRVLHPRAVAPLRWARVPLHLRGLDSLDGPGTVISAAGPDPGPQVKAIAARSGITLISIETVGMWQEVGFLADVFACFGRHGISIDAVSTSETSLTLSLDPVANLSHSTAHPGAALDSDGAALPRLLADLGQLGEARVIAPTAALSLLGRGIRAILHELGPALEVFEELKVHLLTQAASDLNLTFVVDEDASERLVKQLHGSLFQHRTEGAVLGPTWEELRADRAAAAAPGPRPWWAERRQDLLDLAAAESPLYVYDAETLKEAAQAVLGLDGVDRVFYAVKANANPEVLALFHGLGLGLECVSTAELELAVRLFPDLRESAGTRLLFTPNFAPAAEYRRGFELGAQVTVDNLHPLRHWPELFEGKEIFLRLDPGRGRGHHAHVRTAGAQSKFGLSLDQLDDLQPLLDRCGARVVGLHAHAGSGIRTAEAWGETALFLAAAAPRFPHLRALDLGGGLGIPERPGQTPLDLGHVADSLLLFRQAHPGMEIWLEPGRFLVARAGVLLAKVTQIKRKGEVTYVGAETGMNSLIRPALYGAYHPIVNLTRLGEPETLLAHVVGPICETGDVLGRSRRLAPAQEGDVLLIANAGAYGRVMSSSYNLREPAAERLLAVAIQT
jgi:diaminopimelate decarboxylase/aspartate kinase